MLAFQPDTVAADPLSDIVDRLNAVAVSAVQLAGALDGLSTLSPAERDDPAAQAATLRAFAQQAGVADPCVAAVLHARVTALTKWRAAHDPDCQANGEAMIEAAARFALGETDEGIGFEPGGFQEMTLFIEELPW